MNLVSNRLNLCCSSIRECRVPEMRRNRRVRAILCNGAGLQNEQLQCILAESMDFGCTNGRELAGIRNESIVRIRIFRLRYAFVE